MLAADTLECGVDLEAPHTVAVEREPGHLQGQLKLANERLRRAEFS